MRTDLLSLGDKKLEEPHDTRKLIAKDLGRLVGSRLFVRFEERHNHAGFWPLSLKCRKCDNHAGFGRSLKA